MPDGSDRVLIQEDCRREGDALHHNEPIPPSNRHVRRSGLDFSAGETLLVARRGGQIIIGLPGNPASAFVTAFLFVLPLLRAALGCAEPLPRAERVRLGAPLEPGGKRLEFLRARLAEGQAVPEAEQDSGALLPLARADALIRREVGAPATGIGDMVQVYRIQFG